MGTSSLAWLPWTVVLSALGLFAAWLALRKGDRSAVVRRLGWAVLPWGLYFMGLIKFGARVTDAVADWAAGFAFSPMAWAGVGLSIVSVLMIGGGAFLSNRRAGKRSSGGQVEAPSKQVREKPAPKQTSGKKEEPAVEDSDDIEAILRRHGIE